MNITSGSLRRPITTFMVFIALIVVGIVAFSQLAIDLLPDIEFPTVSVSVQYEGDELEISFNAQYILDFLSAVDGEDVVFKLKDSASQGLLEPHEGNTEGSRYKYVIMPMRM